MNAGKRWVCPTCGGGVNAPSRPRKDDVRRYCLGCSAKTGRLVERTCPSLERLRAEKRERSQTRAKARKATAVAAVVERRTIGEFSIDAEAYRLWNLPVFRQQPRWRKRLPDIEVRRSQAKRHTSGHASFNGSRIVLTIGSDVADGLSTLLHELAHPIIGKPNGQIHPEAFWTFVRSAARQAWPDAPFTFNEPPGPLAWHKHNQITLGLRTWLEHRDDIAASPSRSDGSAS